jgi:methyl-accepting chemotaxis protein
MNKPSITSQITILIILFLTVGVCIAFMVNGWTTQRQFAKANEERLAAETTVLSETLALPLWSYNDAAVQTISEAFAAHGEVAFITVTSNASPKPVVQIRNPGNEESLTSLAKIEYEGEVIGSVEVGLGSEALRTRLKESFTYTLFLMSVMTLIIIAGIRFSLSRLIEKPIDTLASWARQIAHGNYLAGDDGSMNTRELAPIAEQIRFMSGEIELRERRLNAHIALEETLGRIHRECIAFRKWDQANHELLQAAMTATKSKLGFIAELAPESVKSPIVDLYAHPNTRNCTDAGTLAGGNR